MILWLSLLCFSVPSHDTGYLFQVMTQGHQLFIQKRCAYCHAIRGVGGEIGSDLSRSAKGKSFYDIIGTLWTHAPFMKAQMDALGLQWPTFQEGEIKILFDFLFYLNFFDLPGDPAEGKRIFFEKQCHFCHAKGSTAPDPKHFPKDASNLFLGSMLWNHMEEMGAMLRRKGVAYPTFHGMELIHLFAYFRQEALGPSLKEQGVRGREEEGKKVFRKAQCIACHSVFGVGGKGGPDLGEVRLSYSMTQILGILWNHYPQMQNLMKKRGIGFPTLNTQSLADLITYLYAINYRGNHPDPQKGKKVFEKNCAACHSFQHQGSSLAADLSEIGKLSEEDFLQRVWNALPNMVKLAHERNIAMVKLSGEDMLHLVAYLRGGVAQP